MLADFWAQLSTAGQAVVKFFTSIIQGCVDIFYVQGTSGSTGEFTFIGVVALSFLAIGLFYGVFRLVRGLIRM